MKRLTCAVMIGLLSFLLLLPEASVFGQAKKDSGTFPGDTESTIARRAKWIEGAKKEGQMVWWGSASPQEAQKFISAFNKVYPFVKVDFWRGTGEETAAKIDADFASGRNTSDVCLGAEWVYLPRWRQIGIFEKVTEILPGIRKMDKDMYSAHGDWALPGNNAVIPAYNTKKVSSTDAPKSWEGLLDPKWKGQFGMTTDMKLWSVLSLAEGGWGVEKTEEFLKKIKQHGPIWARGHREGYTLLVAGEFNVYADAYLRYTFDPKQPGDWVRVRPVPVMGPPFFLLKKAPHPNAARLFLEWTFTPQGLARYEEATGYGAAFAGSGTRLAKMLEGVPLIYRTEEVTLKIIETKLEERFAKILGVTPE